MQRAIHMLEKAWAATNDGYQALRDNRHFRWIGPTHKSEAEYYTHEGWVLGTQCWVVGVEVCGWRHRFFDLTPEKVIARAWRWAEPAMTRMLAGEKVGQPTREEYGHYDDVMREEA